MEHSEPRHRRRPFPFTPKPARHWPVNGICLFDNANGSLRLTERLAENFQPVLALAIETERKQGNESLVQQLESLATLAQTLTPVQASGPSRHPRPAQRR